MSITAPLHYQPLKPLGTPMSKLLSHIETIEGFGRVYHLNDGRSLMGNTTILREDMDANGMKFWLKKLTNKDGDVEKARQKAEWVRSYATYTGTMFHRSLERIIIQDTDPEMRRERINKHVAGHMFAPYTRILGSELPALASDYATTLDLVLETESGDIEIVEFKTIHRVGSDDDEADIALNPDRSLQSNKRSKYGLQLAAQTKALEEFYGVKASRVAIWLFDTADFTVYEAAEWKGKRLQTKIKGFEEAKDEKLQSLQDWLASRELFGEPEPDLYTKYFG